MKNHSYLPILILVLLAYSLLAGCIVHQRIIYVTPPAMPPWDEYASATPLPIDSIDKNPPKPKPTIGPVVLAEATFLPARTPVTRKDIASPTPSPTPRTEPKQASATPTKLSTPMLTPTLEATDLVCLEPPTGLISLWTADGNAHDIIGVNDGTLKDGATFAAGKVRQAFSFDGTSHMSAPTTGLPTTDSNRTLDLWVKVDTFFDGEAFFAGYGSFGSFEQSFHLGAAGNTLFFSQWGQAIFGPALQTGRWYHIAVTNTGASVTLYLDGAAVASGDMSIHTPQGTKLFVGSLPGDASKRLDGLIDEVGIFDRALSAAEVRAIYLAGSQGKCK